MILERLKNNLIEDDEFNAIYPEEIRKLSSKHWTPVEVAKTAAKFLVNRPGVKVLDIGSGVGKFCMIGASITEGHFTGVEYRENLYQLAGKLSNQSGLVTVKFLHGNITNINFKDFDAFYFFNSFIENMSESEVMDNAVPINPLLYSKYTQYLREQFAAMPVGTRVATYWSNSEEVPRGYIIVASGFEGELKLWEKLF